MEKHSPIPWTYEENEDSQMMVYDAEDYPVAQIISTDCVADAKFIVELANDCDRIRQTFIEQLAESLTQRDKLSKELGQINDVAVNLQRSKMTLLEENNSLRDLIRRLAHELEQIKKHLKDEYERGSSWMILEGNSFMGNVIDNIIQEAREAIKEDEP